MRHVPSTKPIGNGALNATLVPTAIGPSAVSTNPAPRCMAHVRSAAQARSKASSPRRGVVQRRRCKPFGVSPPREIPVGP